MNPSDFIRPHDPTLDLEEGEIKRINVSKGGCPDCGGALVDGPSAGHSHNVKCLVCRAEYNLFFWGYEVFNGHRIDRDELELYRGGLFCRAYGVQQPANVISTVLRPQEVLETSIDRPAAVAHSGAEHSSRSFAKLAWALLHRLNPFK